METFTICTRMGQFVQIAVIFAFGALPTVFLINGGGGPVSVIICAGVVLGIISVLRNVHTIRLERNGRVRFERLVSTIEVNVRDIAVLEGFRKNEYDGTVWKMRVRYRGGTVTLPFFVGAEEFALAVRALEPRVSIQGEWPTLDPWGKTA